MPMPDRLPRSSRAAISSEIERQAFECGDSRPDGKRKLRAGAEPGMRRDHLVEMQMIGRGETEACRDRAEIGLGPLASERR